MWEIKTRYGSNGCRSWPEYRQYGAQIAPQRILEGKDRQYHGGLIHQAHLEKQGRSPFLIRRTPDLLRSLGHYALKTLIDFGTN
ncbi:hypothetical protein ES703_61955 [subsurface metagenome]